MLFSQKSGCILRCLQKGGNLDRTSESKTARHQQSQPNRDYYVEFRVHTRVQAAKREIWTSDWTKLYCAFQQIDLWAGSHFLFCGSLLLRLCFSSDSASLFSLCILQDSALCVCPAWYMLSWPHAAGYGYFRYRNASSVHISLCC